MLQVSYRQHSERFWFVCFLKLVSLFSVQATAEANNLTAVAGAKDLYSKNMEKVRRGWQEAACQSAK